MSIKLDGKHFSLEIQERLKKTISELNSSSDLRNKLSKNIKKSAFKNATKDIVDEIKILMN